MTHGPYPQYIAMWQTLAGCTNTMHFYKTGTMARAFDCSAIIITGEGEGEVVVEDAVLRKKWNV